MNLLAAKLYDPSTAVSKSTTAAIAMTAIDTTNLRLAITVPAHGIVRFRMGAVVHGATTFPSILMGVMNGSTVLGRVAPVQSLGTTAVATSLVSVEAEFTVTGLTPGALNCDAAYGVETAIASTGLKYGGPNNTTGNDAFGGFYFEAWDPQPMKTGLDGGVNVTQFGGTNGTFASGRPETNTTHWGGTAVASAVVLNAANIGADAITAAKIADNAIDAGSIASGAITSAKFGSGAIDATAFAQGAADKVWSTAARVLTAGTNIALAKGTGVTGFNDLDASGVRTAVGLASANLDTQLDALDNLDATVSSRLATAGYTAPANSDVAAIKAKTDSLTFTVAGKLDSNILAVNGITVQGSGTAGSPWGP